jgi:hypothetical protein
VDRVIVVGSQSILGSFDIDELPAVTHLSAEVDVMPDVDDLDLMVESSDRIEGVGGELCAGREKDRAFVAALFGAHLVDRDVVRHRLGTMPSEHGDIAAIVLAEHFR